MIELIDNIGIDFLFGSQSAFLDHVALLLTNAYVWIPMFLALFLLVIKNHDNMQQILLCLGCVALCLLIASGTANFLVKPMVERLRPCNDPQYKYLACIAGNMHERDFSFFSSHAANTMAVATFFTLLVRSSLLGMTLYAWSFINMWTRLYLGQHFITDIIVGMVWGIVSALIAYTLFRKMFQNMSNSNKFVSTQYTSTGFSLLDIDVVVSAFFFTLLLIMIPLFDIIQTVSSIVSTIIG